MPDMARRPAASVLRQRSACRAARIISPIRCRRACSFRLDPDLAVLRCAPCFAQSSCRTSAVLPLFLPLSLSPCLLLVSGLVRKRARFWRETGQQRGRVRSSCGAPRLFFKRIQAERESQRAATFGLWVGFYSAVVVTPRDVLLVCVSSYHRTFKRLDGPCCRRRSRGLVD